MFTQFKNLIIGGLYRHIAKPIFFAHDPESTHDFAVRTGVQLGSHKLTRIATRCAFYFSDTRLEQTILGIHFKNPIGLSAGFDKNAELISILPHVGFGFAELGSFTAKPYEGNPKPRLWRFPKHKSLGVWFGLKNNGITEIAPRIKKTHSEIPLGMCIAKTNCKETVDTEAGVADYIKCYKALYEIGSYDTINISCPNTFGGQPFINREKLETLLQAISKVRNKKPLFIKLSPNLTQAQLDDVIELGETYNVDGFVCTNLHKPKGKKELDGIAYKGGLSGKLVDDLSTNMISYVYKKTHGKKIIIGVGGIFSAKDAYEKIKAGASLVQLITGMIYQGPQLISEINRGMVKLLKKDGYTNISKAIGTKNN